MLTMTVTEELHSDPARLRRARAVRRLGLSTLAVFVLAGLLGVFGERTSITRSEVDGSSLEIEYASRSRGGLPAPFDATLQRRGGFDAPIVVRMSSSWLSALDENGFDPDPSAATAGEGFVQWTFDPPPGDTLTISIDARFEPGRFGRVNGWMEIVDPTDNSLKADFSTWLAP